MSIPFSLAVAALEGAAGEREFREELLSSPLHQAFASRVRVEADPELTKAFPAEWPAYVRVVLKDRRVHERYIPYPKGEPEAPMSDAEVEKKFMDLATLSISADRASDIVEEVSRLDRTRDISRPMSLLRGDDARA